MESSEERSLHSVFPVDKPKVDGSRWTEQAVGFGFDLSGDRRHFDAEFLDQLKKKQKHNLFVCLFQDTHIIYDWLLSL